VLAFGLFGSLTLACTDSGESSVDSSEFCSLLVSAADPFAADEGSLEAVTDDLRNLATAAPAEIAPAVDTLLAAFEAVAAESDPDEAAALLAENQEELVAASDELAAYALTTCGIDLNR